MRLDILTGVPLFSMLTQLELEQLVKSTTVVTVAAGEFLFRRGDQGDALYIVEEGLLDAVIDEDTPSERSLNTFFTGDFFGEMALLTQEPRSASIRALIDSRLLRLSYEKFSELLEARPTMALHLSRVLSRYLSKTNTNLSRQTTRISTIISLDEGKYDQLFALQLLGSLERQFGTPAMMIILDCFKDMELEQATSVAAGTIQDFVKPFPTGGAYLYFNENSLRKMDEQTMVAIIHRLRLNYPHIIVWTQFSEAFKKLAFLTRFDQVCLIASAPFKNIELNSRCKELNKVLKGNLRVALLAPKNQPLPAIDAKFPPVRISVTPESLHIAREGVDTWARSLAGARVGLALGSGTAQGLAHLGVLKAFIEAGIPIDLIAGTSGGALYGSMMASGLTIEESITKAIYHTRRNLMDKLDFTLPIRGIIRGNSIERMIQTILGEVSFSDLPIPLYAVATDLESGEEVVIKEGLVYKGVRASISVPGIFQPYLHNGRFLVDGVVVNPLPVNVVRNMGADIVIAVQVPAPAKVEMEAKARKTMRQKSEYNIISAIIRSHHFGGEMLSEKAISEADVFVKPDVTRFGWREYRAAPEIIEEGYRAGKGAIKQIKALMGYMTIGE